MRALPDAHSSTRPCCLFFFCCCCCFQSQMCALVRFFFSASSSSSSTSTIAITVAAIVSLDVRKAFFFSFLSLSPFFSLATTIVLSHPWFRFSVFLFARGAERLPGEQHRRNRVFFLFFSFFKKG